MDESSSSAKNTGSNEGFGVSWFRLRGWVFIVHTYGVLIDPTTSTILLLSYQHQTTMYVHRDRRKKRRLIGHAIFSHANYLVGDYRT